MLENLNLMEFIGLYLVLQIIYVVLNTVTNIAKIKCSKLVASISSAVCYGFYVVVVVATASNYPLWVKMALTAITNLVGVYVGMAIMEKLKKDKLWEITATLKADMKALAFDEQLQKNNISYSCVLTADAKHWIYNIYSKTQKESIIVKQLLKENNAKYIVHEESAKL